MSGIHVVQLVCGDGFAGVERHMITSALAQRAQGLRVSVVGGAADMMRAGLKGADIEWRPGDSVRQAMASARGLPPADIVNTHMTQADFAGAVLALRTGTPVVSTRHFARRRGTGVINGTMARWISSRITAQIAVSHYVSQRVEGPSVVVHSGVPPVQVEPGGRERVALVVQRMEAEKQTGLAIRAWARLGSERDGWRLDLLGGGAELASLERLTVELGVSDSVRLLGFQTDVGARMNRASVLIATTPSEAFGLSVVEAMARAVPVVATASGGHLETVGSAPGAALYEPGDASGLAARLSSLLTDAARRDEYGAVLQTLQRQNFTAEAQARGAVELYTRVLAS